EPVESEAVEPVRSGGRVDLPRRGWSGGEIVSWIVIVLAVLLVFGMPLLLNSGSAAKKREAAERHPPMQTLLSGRYLVGLNSLYPLEKAGQAQTSLRAMDIAAKTPVEKFRIAIVRGEVEGKEKALAAVEPLLEQDAALKDDVE